MLGFAFQQGLVPLGLDALERAIELNGVAVEAQQPRLRARPARRCRSGPLRGPRGGARPRAGGARRHAADDRASASSRPTRTRATPRATATLVERVVAAEAERTPGQSALAAAVARYYFKLLAYKDEYEVARLYAGAEFRELVTGTFAGGYRLRFHLAPPGIARPDPATGQPRKMSFGGWMLPAFRLLARLRFVRGTPFDPFGYRAERRLERRLIADYERLVDELLAGLTPERHALAVELASLPEQLRGYGHVKERHLAALEQRQAELLGRLRAGAALVERAA